MVKEVKKILIIRFSSIGDIVLTSAVVRCLKEKIKDAEVHFLTKKQYALILSANPNIDKIWLYDNNFHDLIPQLKSQGFDFIVDLHKNYRSIFVKYRLGVKSGSFPKMNLQKWLAVRFKMKSLPDIHIVDRYFKAAAPLGLVNDRQGLDYFIPAEDEVALTSLPETHRQGYIAIVIGGKHNTKIFPPEKVIEVCEKLGQPVILLGGKEDMEHGKLIASNSKTTVYNSSGRYNINQSASLIRQARAVLTNDTGLMHVAAAFRKPMVSVWGNTIPAFGMYPYLPEESRANSMIAEVKDLSCRPCSKLGFEKCPKKHFQCMNDINTKPIADFLIAAGQPPNRKS
ncbi:MAG: glycosyltransferase family 9 protein [Bacteroidales bacterium]|nr:glycosyltransferase family 9 protein [Bacteroidales bacterium]